MDEFELKRIIYDYIKEICHYSQMQVFATSSYQKNYFQCQIDEAANGLFNIIQECRTELMENRIYTIQQKSDGQSAGWQNQQSAPQQLQQ